MHSPHSEDNLSAHVPPNPPAHHVSAVASDPWAVEVLLKKAFARTKSRLLSIILSSLLSMLITGGVVLVTSLVLGIPLFGLYGSSQYALAVSMTGLGLVALFAAVIYVSAWGQLATVYLITSESSVGVMAAWQHVRPLVSRGFIAMSIVSLFLLGLVPLGFVTLFIPLMIWNVLFAFIPFILVTTGKSASEAVWSSKDMVLTRFWGIFGRTVLMILLLQVVAFCIGLVLAIFTGQTDSAGGGRLLANLLNVAISYLAGPFTLAFAYEMYKLIAVPHTAKVPRIWIIASGVGIVVMVIGIISMISFASTVDWKGMSKRMGGMMNEQGAKRGDRYGRNPYKDVDVDTMMPQYDSQ
ncbi:MAG: hypothetical protein WCJ70_01715 [bacterium]